MYPSPLLISRKLPQDVRVNKRDLCNLILNIYSMPRVLIVYVTLHLIDGIRAPTVARNFSIISAGARR